MPPRPDSEGTEEQIRLGEIEMEIKRIGKRTTQIWRKNNPDKLKDFETVWKNNEGKEDALLEAVKQKYSIDSIRWPSEDFQWSFVLKRYPVQAKKGQSKEMAIWKIDEGLQNVQGVLEERATSIGGECKMQVKGRDRILVVQHKANVALCDKGKVTSTVEAMRMELVHRRYSYKSRPSDVQNEHDRRKLEKERDQRRKGGHQKKQGRGFR